MGDRLRGQPGDPGAMPVPLYDQQMVVLKALLHLDQTVEKVVSMVPELNGGE